MHYILFCSVAEAGRLKIVKIMTGSNCGNEAISIFDDKGRNVFHYAVKYPEIIQHLLTVGIITTIRVISIGNSMVSSAIWI
jgi:hypothetical protein